MKRLLASVLLSLSISGAANAVVIDFESGFDPLFTYDGIEYGAGAPVPGTGYRAVLEHTNSGTLLYNPSEVSPSVFTWASNGTFELNSFVIAGAWGSQTLTIEGLIGNTVLYSSQLAVDNFGVDIFSPEWRGLTSFRIITGNDFALTPDLGGSGQHWALDNLTINAEVPEPSGLALIGLALASAAFARRRQV